MRPSSDHVAAVDRLERVGLEQRPSWELAGALLRARRECNALADELVATSAAAAAAAKDDATKYRTELIATRRALEQLLVRIGGAAVPGCDCRQELGLETALTASPAFLRAVVSAAVDGLQLQQQ